MLLITLLFVVVLEAIAGLLSLLLPGGLAIAIVSVLFMAGVGFVLLARRISKPRVGIPDLAMDELFKYRRQGQSPEECVRSTIANLVRPENAELADSLEIDCSRTSEGQGEAELFRMFATTLAIRTKGNLPLKEVAEDIVNAVRKSYELQRGVFDDENASKDGPDGSPSPLKPLDVLLKEHHAFLDTLGDIENWVYGAALTVFFAFWLGLKWPWWQAWLLQFGVMAVLFLASTNIAGYRVRVTARRICMLYPPHSPNHEAALKRLSEIDGAEVQLIEDVLTKTRSLAAEVRT
jgi:hypothetical protein